MGKNKFILLITALLVTSMLLTTPFIAAPQKTETVLHVLQPCEPPPPLRGWNVFYRGKPSYMIFERLFYESRGERKFYPWLATDFSTEETDKFLKVTIHLRKGVKWSDGKEFTALDVLTTFWCFGWLRGWWPIPKYIDHMEAPDKYTVIMYIIKPPPLAWKRWFFSRSIVSYSQYGQFAPGLKIPGKIPLEGVDIDDLKKKLENYKPDKYIGTGPYEYESESATEWVYKLRPNYWVKDLKVVWKLETAKGTFEFGGGVPGYKLFDKIIWHRRISDPASWPLIMAGKFDYTWTGISETCYETVKKKPGYWVPTGPWLHGHAIAFNCKKFPLKVRQAIAYAIDLDEYCKVAVEWGPDSVVKAEWPVCISPSDVYNWLDKKWLEKYIDKYEYNPDKAAKLLQEAGYTKKNGWWYTPDGNKFSITVTVPAGWTGWVPGAENVAAQLRRFGIDAKVRELDWGMWGDTVRKRGDFDLAIEFWGYGLYHPFDTYNSYYLNYGIKGFGFDPIVEVPEEVSKYHGTVNASELTSKLAENPNDKELVKALAYITNHYLPALQMHEKKWANTVCIDHIDCAVSWEVFMWYKPIQIEMGNNPSFVYGFLLCSGLWRPKAPTPPPTPTIPSGLAETINATYKAVTTLSSDVATLKSDVASLSDKVAALSGQVGSLTTIAAIEGVVIIILAIALVAVLLKTKKKEE